MARGGPPGREGYMGVNAQSLYRGTTAISSEINKINK